jgi:hypothetical protein
MCVFGCLLLLLRAESFMPESFLATAIISQSMMETAEFPMVVQMSTTTIIRKIQAVCWLAADGDAPVATSPPKEKWDSF